MATYVLDEEVLELIEDHIRQYPEMDPVDLYKLVFQRYMGPGHALTQPQEARALLIEEARAATQASAGNEEHQLDTVEVLDAARGLARVHLVPYLRAGGEIDRLYRAFVETAARMHPDVDGLKQALAALAQLIDEDALDVDFDLSQWRRIFGSASRQDFPPMGHSTRYRDAYRPAYRVVLLACLESAQG